MDLGHKQGFNNKSFRYKNRPHSCFCNKPISFCNGIVECHGRIMYSSCGYYLWCIKEKGELLMKFYHHNNIPSLHAQHLILHSLSSIYHVQSNYLIKDDRCTKLVSIKSYREAVFCSDLIGQLEVTWRQACRASTWKQSFLLNFAAIVWRINHVYFSTAVYACPFSIENTEKEQAR